MKLRYYCLSFFAIAIALANGACATKSYVQKTLDPVNNKLGDVAKQTNQQGQADDQTAKSLDQTRQDLEATKQSISAANERALSAENRAGDALTRAGTAMTRADEANRKSEKLGHDVDDLKSTVEGLDDYKSVSSAAVYFKVNSYALDDVAKQQLDQLVSIQNQYKRYFVTVKGFTDGTGSSGLNDTLSRHRAEAVVKYLVAEHNFPIYKLQLVGLGKAELPDKANTAAARAKNRRVEISVFTSEAAETRVTAGNPK